MRISVIGSGTSVDSGTSTSGTTAVAERLGELLAERGHTVVCGGLGGVMEATCRGARRADGRTIGILPSDRPTDANRFVTDPIATGLGHARNAIVAMNGDAVVAIAGGPGTLSEIGMALVYDRPIAGIDTHDVDGVEPVPDPKSAVEYVEMAARKSRNVD